MIQQTMYIYQVCSMFFTLIQKFLRFSYIPNEKDELGKFGKNSFCIISLIIKLIKVVQFLHSFRFHLAQFHVYKGWEIGHEEISISSFFLINEILGNTCTFSSVSKNLKNGICIWIRIWGSIIRIITVNCKTSMLISLKYEI